MAKSKSAYSVPGKIGKIERHIIVVWVDNEAGVLARIAGLFSGRGYNIESLAVAEVDKKKHISRITIVTEGTPQVIEQINLQLKKLVPVHKVADFKRGEKDILFRELALFKILPKFTSSFFKTIVFSILFDSKKRDIYLHRLSGISNSIFKKKILV